MATSSGKPLPDGRGSDQEGAASGQSRDREGVVAELATSSGKPLPDGRGSDRKPLPDRRGSDRKLVSDARGRHVVAFFGLLALLLTALALCAPLSHDEHMYITAGVLLRDRALYTDFAYLQMPYFPAALWSVFELTGFSHLLLAARLFCASAGVASAWFVYLVCRRVAASRTMALACVALYATHHITLFVAPYARNHVVAIALSLAAFYAAARALEGGAKELCWSAASGALIGLAVGVKLTHLPLLVAIALGVSLPSRFERFARIAVTRLLPFAGGAALALFPAAVWFLRVGAGVFLFNNVGYHELNRAWIQATGDTDTLTLAGKLAYAGIYAIKGSGVALLAALGIVLARVFRFRGRMPLSSPRAARPTRLAALCLVATLIGAFMPSPMQRDYLAMIVPLLAILLACVAAKRSLLRDRLLRRSVCGLAVVSLLVGGITSLRHLRVLGVPSRWPPIAVERISGELAYALSSRSDEPAQVATLAPIYALEAHQRIYVELASGPFLFRVADNLSPESRARFRATSVSTLASLLRSNPPAAVLITDEHGLERSLLAFAKSNGYQRLAAAEMGALRVYLRPTPP